MTASTTRKAAAAAAAAAPSTDWILVTGQPGCGKTTAVQTMVSRLKKAGIRCQGFFTEEVRDATTATDKNGSSSSTRRIGFDVVTLPEGNRGLLARRCGCPKQWPKTGAYSVDVASFEQLALKSLQLPALLHDQQHAGEQEQQQQFGKNLDVVYVLDEIGRMELHSNEFPKHVRAMLQRGVRLIGAIAAAPPRDNGRRRMPFCEEVKAVPGVQVHLLTKNNRNDVVDTLLEDISKRWISKTTTSLSSKASSLPSEGAAF